MSADAKTKSAPNGSSHWRNIATQWNLVGPPLRPSPQDTDYIAKIISSRHGASIRAMILGTTPEFYQLAWPPGTDLLAVDRSQPMIDALWPGVSDTAICAAWTDIPAHVGTRDLVLCDGGLSVLAYPHEQRMLAESLRCIVTPGGQCVFRLYVAPTRRESADAVLVDLLAGKVSSLNALKLRLWTALEEDSTKGVELNHVWETVHRAAPNLEALASQIHWPLAQLQTINTYRQCTDRYYFPGIEQVCALFCGGQGGFEFQASHVPAYELGEQCPTIVLRRR